MYEVWVTEKRIIKYIVDSENPEEAQEQVESSESPDEDFGFKTYQYEWGVDEVKPC